MEMIQKLLATSPEIVLMLIIILGFGIWFMVRIFGNSKGQGSY